MIGAETSRRPSANVEIKFFKDPITSCFRAMGFMSPNRCPRTLQKLVRCSKLVDYCMQLQIHVRVREQIAEEPVMS